jgi:hypothetical protein
VPDSIIVYYTGGEICDSSPAENPTHLNTTILISCGENVFDIDSYELSDDGCAATVYAHSLHACPPAIYEEHSHAGLWIVTFASVLICVGCVSVCCCAARKKRHCTKQPYQELQLVKEEV